MEAGTEYELREERLILQRQLQKYVDGLSKEKLEELEKLVQGVLGGLDESSLGNPNR